MKKILLILIFVSLLIAIIFSLNSKPTVVESPIENTPQVTSAPTNAEVQKNSGKVLAVMPQEYNKEEPRPSEGSVPWEELDEKWMEDLKTFIIGLDPETGANRFHAYSVIHKKWNDYNKVFTKEANKFVTKYRTLDSPPIYSNNKAYDKLTQEWSMAFENHRQQTKLIFGKHYADLKKLNAEFTDSIQGYGRDPEVPLGNDPAFLD